MQLTPKCCEAMQNNSFTNFISNPRFVSILQIERLKIRALYAKKKKNGEVDLRVEYQLCFHV